MNMCSLPSPPKPRGTAGATRVRRAGRCRPAVFTTRLSLPIPGRTPTPPTPPTAPQRHKPRKVSFGEVEYHQAALLLEGEEEDMSFMYVAKSLELPDICPKVAPAGLELGGQLEEDENEDPYMMDRWYAKIDERRSRRSVTGRTSPGGTPPVLSPMNLSASRLLMRRQQSL